MRKSINIKKLLLIHLFIVIFIPSITFAADDFDDFKGIKEAQEEFNKLETASDEVSQIIDEAIKELDKATDFVKNNLNNSNKIDENIKALEFIERSIGDVANIIPAEFSSDMSNIDLSTFNKEDMKVVSEITNQMKSTKEEKFINLVQNMLDLSEQGLNFFEISDNLNKLGVDTIKVDLSLLSKKDMETWNKNDWANSWKGEILTDDGNEIITDDEIKTKVVDLEKKFQENTIAIASKRTSLSSLNSKLNPINLELNNLNQKKSLLTSQYNLELSKLSLENLPEIETKKSKELSEKLKKELADMSNKIKDVEQESSNLKSEISNLNDSLNNEILLSNEIRENMNTLSNDKLKVTDSIALKTTELKKLKGESSSINSNDDISKLNAKLDESNNLQSQLDDFRTQIENKNLAVSEKISQINGLNSKLNPLDSQIDLLKQRKTNLKKQYNLELENINSSLNNNELSKSTELADNLNNEINSVTNNIKTLETNSSKLQSDITMLNFELNTEKDSVNQISINIASSQKELNRTNDIIDAKELGLDRLRNTDLAKNNQQLNQQLNKISLERDFIQVDFEKSIDKEVEALRYYGSVLGDTEYEIDFAMREVGVILDGDPRKARAFEIEKYATYAGMSKDYIQKGIDAVNNDDWDTQKQYYKDITKSLAKNPKWTVDVPSNAEFNVMIAEEKAIQEAAMIAIEGQKIKEQVNKIIEDRTSSLKNLASLNTTTLQYAATWEGMPEHEFLTNEFNKIISNSDFSQKSKELEELTKKVKDAHTFLRQANTLRYSGQKFTQQMEAEVSKKYYEAINGARDLSPLQMDVSRIQGNAMSQARSNLVNMVEDAKNNIEKIRSEEIAKNPAYNYAEDINKILDQIPSFDAAKRQRANEVLSGIGHTDIWFGGVPIDVGEEGAALRAALGEQSDYEAYNEALKVMGEIGEAPVSEYMTGPYWEMTNVKAAAIVRSKKYDYVDDYAYINAYYEEPLQLTSSDRAKLEKELGKILGNNNPKLNALNKQTLALKSQIENNNIQLSNININISKLETEISSIKSSEENLKNQIAKLNNDLSSKQSIINEKNISLGNFQKEQNPFKVKINELETKKANLNKQIESQIDLIFQNTKKSKEISEKTKELENKLNNEISKIDKEINVYKEDSKKLSTNISSLNNEIMNLEQEKPELSNKILEINKELTGYGEVKAELSLLNNKQKKKTENIDLEINKLEAELIDLKSTENGINLKLSYLTKDLQTKENIIKNNNLFIAKIQKQLDPINNQIKTLESQKTSLNEQFNKDLAEISMQTDVTKNSRSSEIDKLKANFENQRFKINEEINNFENESKELIATVSKLNKEIEIIDVKTPQITEQITKLNTEIRNIINMKADLAISKAGELGIKIEKKIIEAVAKLENKSLISINGTSLMRIVDTDMLTDEGGNFKTPVGTLTRGNQIFTAGDLDRESLFSVDKIDAEGDLKLSISKEAAEKINSGLFNLDSKASIVATSDMGQGIYTLIDPKTGRQVMKDGRGYHGGIVCTGDVCGPDGAFGKKALSEGFVYVMQTQTGGTMCSGAGDCTFNIGEQGRKQVEEQMKGDLSTNVNWGNSWEGLSVNTSGINTVSENLKSSVSSVSSSIKKSTKSVSLTISKTELNKAVTKSTSSLSFLPKGAFKKGNQIIKPVSAGIGLRGSPETQATTLQSLGSVEEVAAQAAASSQAASAASEGVTDSVAEISKAVEEVAKEVASNVEEVSKEVASVAKEVSGFISGNDLKGISELANNALGAWVLVSQTTGKQILNADGSTKHGGIWCTGDTCGSQGSFGKAEAAKGNVYVYVGSGTPCAAGDCEFDPEQLK